MFACNTRTYSVQWSAAHLVFIVSTCPWATLLSVYQPTYILRILDTYIAYFLKTYMDTTPSCRMLLQPLVLTGDLFFILAKFCLDVDNVKSIQHRRDSKYSTMLPTMSINNEQVSIKSSLKPVFNLRLGLQHFY